MSPLLTHQTHISLNNLYLGETPPLPQTLELDHTFGYYKEKMELPKFGRYFTDSGVKPTLQNPSPGVSISTLIYFITGKGTRRIELILLGRGYSC